MTKLSLTLDPIGISHFHLLFGIGCTGGPLPVFLNMCQSENEHGHQGQLCVPVGPNFKHLLIRNYKVDFY